MAEKENLESSKKEKKRITFPANIIVTEKNHWYVTIPNPVKQILVKEKNKTVNVTLEEII